MSDTIMAIDLGRFKGVVCLYRRAAREAVFRTIDTAAGEFEDLLSQRRLPGPREARARESDRADAVRAEQCPPPAPVLDLQGPVLRAQGHPLVRRPAADGHGRRRRRPCGRGDRRPEDGPADRGPPRHGHAAHPLGRPARRTTPRRTRGFFPRRRPKSSSMRSGRLSAGKRRTVRRTTPGAGTVGTTRRSTPRVGWSSA